MLPPATTSLPSPLPSPYIGRFAPSPSGPLHFGSLVTALASFLDAKAQGGQWLVRMEDLDPPREQPGAAAAILKTLECHGLQWDGAVMYQSERYDAYQECLDGLIARNLVYPCDCSRQQLAGMGGVYNGHCRNRSVSPNQRYSLRLKLYDLPGLNTAEIIEFDDVIQGPQIQHLRMQAGDQILKRRDGFYAYQLAVVVDDIAQGITHVIRGSDLLDVTARQIFLFQLLGKRPPRFGHLPLAVQSNGQKLSKQNHAPALNEDLADRNLWHALAFLGQNPPQELMGAGVEQTLRWGIGHWQRDRVRGLTRLYLEN